MKEKKTLISENNYFCELGFCCVFVKDFIKLFCKNNLENLADFSFASIISDKTFGDIGKNGGRKKRATCENTKIAKAIYFLLFSSVLNDLNIEDLFAYNFSKVCKYKAIQLFNGDFVYGNDSTLLTFDNLFFDSSYNFFVQRVHNFYNKLNSIGNFLFVPSEFDGVLNYENQLIDDFFQLNYVDKCEIFEILSQMRNSHIRFSTLFTGNVDEKLKQEFIETSILYISKVEKIIDMRACEIISRLKEKTK